MTRPFAVIAAAAALLPPCPAAEQLDWIPVPSASGASRLDGQAGPVFGEPFTATEVRHSTQVLASGPRRHQHLRTRRPRPHAHRQR
jgi:hypothetical protein